MGENPLCDTRATAAMVAAELEDHQSLIEEDTYHHRL